MSQQVSTDPRPDLPPAPTVDEVDVEVGFILGCCTSSLELEDDDLEALDLPDDAAIGDAAEMEPPVPATAD
jgi:hypothetical protein